MVPPKLFLLPHRFYRTCFYVYLQDDDIFDEIDPDEIWDAHVKLQQSLLPSRSSPPPLLSEPIAPLSVNPSHEQSSRSTSVNSFPPISSPKRQTPLPKSSFASRFLLPKKKTQLNQSVRTPLSTPHSKQNGLSLGSVTYIDITDDVVAPRKSFASNRLNPSQNAGGESLDLQHPIPTEKENQKEGEESAVEKESVSKRLKESLTALRKSSSEKYQNHNELEPAAVTNPQKQVSCVYFHVSID